MIVMSTVSAALVILYFKLKGGLKEFTFSYTIEKEGDYKSILTLDSNKNYRIEKLPLTDNTKGTPSVYEKKLTNEEYKKIKRQLERCNLLKMKDFYGTDNMNDKQSETLYHIYISTPKKVNYISIRNRHHKKLSRSFHKLLEYMDVLHQ